MKPKEWPRIQPLPRNVKSGHPFLMKGPLVKSSSSSSWFTLAFKSLLLFYCLLSSRCFLSDAQSYGLNSFLPFNGIPDNLQLKDYRLLEPSSFRHKIVKRGAKTPRTGHKYNTLKEVSFSAFGRDFRLILNENRDVLSSHFKAYSEGSSGKKVAFNVDNSDLYEGRLFGHLKSQVSAHIDRETGLITASINDMDRNEMYIIEPTWRHAEVADNGINTMLIYKASDVKHSHEMQGNPPTGVGSKPSFCDFVKVNDYVPENETVPNLAQNQSYGRSKRKASYSTDIRGNYFSDIDNYGHGTQTRCSLLLVADHLFFKHMGGENLKQTINFLIALIDRVNKIYLATEWGDSPHDEERIGGMGFVIQEIVVHTEPTEGSTHYNAVHDNWKVRDLLEVFSRNPNHRWFCLAHLFTHRKFDNAVLGLAYVSSARKNSVGGICSPGYHKNNYTLYLNTGLSTTRNTFGHRIITREADLVTAHELGHNWGAEHDPDISECSPKARTGGSYVMYTYSVSGYDPNNKLFSPCSRRSVKAVLMAKARGCFSKPTAAFCGNGLVEEGEECDAGLIGTEDHDLCCDTDCRLRPGAYCSDKNSPCCSECRVEPIGTHCRDENKLSCKRESYCLGSAECPDAESQPNDIDCLDNGKCRNGTCLPFCETLGQHSCMCDTEAFGCNRCCRTSLSSDVPCVPFKPLETLRDGTPCTYGFCEKGRCEKTVQDVVQRFWDVIEEIDVNSFFKFLKDNIVGVVIIITALIWIPASYGIQYYDNKIREEMKKRKARQRTRGSSVGSGASLPPTRLRNNRSQYGHTLVPNSRQRAASVGKPSCTPTTREPGACPSEGLWETNGQSAGKPVIHSLPMGITEDSSDDEGGFENHERRSRGKSSSNDRGSFRPQEAAYPRDAPAYNTRYGLNYRPDLEFGSSNYRESLPQNSRQTADHRLNEEVQLREYRMSRPSVPSTEL